jgi:hypothetical protein
MLDFRKIIGQLLHLLSIPGRERVSLYPLCRDWLWGPPSCPVGTGGPVLSLGVKRRRGMTLTTHPLLMSRSRMSRGYTSSSPSRLPGGSGIALLRNCWKVCYWTYSWVIFVWCLFVCFLCVSAALFVWEVSYMIHFHVKILALCFSNIRYVHSTLFPDSAQ